ncbi:hypothetical protein [Limnobacter parvus]|uniref:Uncharacterized protein n=1 Tax=Limnobacter parvus TaxID=2939690 RepID=A0ABT1XEZ4_9BURK|nr:hypothetical protein [Limnobacter parvus]MCR2745830.1 hypothetical protein [Limnobacter parvus]
MSKKTQWGASIVSMLIGVGLLSITIAGAFKLLGISMNAQNNLNTENLVDQVNRIGELVTVHLNRGGSFKNSEVDAKGIQLCSLSANAKQCNGYNPNTTEFCLSIPTRVGKGGRDVINMTGFRLFRGALAQREMPDADMAQFNHATFCRDDAAWRNLNNTEDYVFSAIRFCRFTANTPQQVTQNYEQNCGSVIENEPQSNMFWIALFKAKIGNGLTEGEYEEAKIIHLLNTTRVRNGS